MARVDRVPIGSEIVLPARCVARYLLPQCIIGYHRAIMAHWGEPDWRIRRAYFSFRRLHRDPA